MSTLMIWKEKSAIVKKLMKALRCDKCKQKLQDPHRLRKCLHVFCAKCAIDSEVCFKCGVSADEGDVIPDKKLSEIFGYCQMLTAESGFRFDDVDPETELIQETETYSDESLDEMINNRGKKCTNACTKRDASNGDTMNKRKLMLEQMDSDVAQIDSDESRSEFLDDVNSEKNVKDTDNNYKEKQIAKGSTDIDSQFDVRMNQKSQTEKDSQFDDDQSQPVTTKSKKMENKWLMKNVNRRKQDVGIEDTRTRTITIGRIESDVSQIESSEACDHSTDKKTQKNKKTQIHPNKALSRRTRRTGQAELNQSLADPTYDQNDKDGEETIDSDVSLDESIGQKRQTNKKVQLDVDPLRDNRSRIKKRRSLVSTTKPKGKPKNVDLQIDSDESLDDVVSPRKEKNKHLDVCLVDLVDVKKKRNNVGQTKSDQLLSDITNQEKNVRQRIKLNDELTEMRNPEKKDEDMDTEPSFSETINFGAKKVKRRQINSSESFIEIPYSGERKQIGKDEQVETEQSLSEMNNCVSKKGARQRINSSESFNEIVSTSRRYTATKGGQLDTEESLSEVITFGAKKVRRRQINSSELLHDPVLSGQKDQTSKDKYLDEDLSLSERIDFGTKRVRRQQIISSELVNEITSEKRETKTSAQLDADQSFEDKNSPSRNKNSSRRIGSEKSLLDSDDSSCDLIDRLSKNNTSSIDLMNLSNEKTKKKPLRLKQSLNNSVKEHTSKKARIDFDDSMDDMMDWINEINKKVESYPKHSDREISKFDDKSKHDKTDERDQSLIDLDNVDDDGSDDEKQPSEKIDIDDELLRETLSSVNYKGKPTEMHHDEPVNDTLNRTKQKRKEIRMDFDDSLDETGDSKPRYNKKEQVHSKQSLDDTTCNRRQSQKRAQMDTGESMDDHQKKTPKKSQICIERTTDKKKQVNNESFASSQDPLSTYINRKKESLKRASICLERSVEDILNRWKESSKKDQSYADQSIDESVDERSYSGKAVQLDLNQSLDDVLDDRKETNQTLQPDAEDKLENITYRKIEKPRAAAMYSKKATKDVNSREKKNVKKDEKLISESMYDETDEKERISNFEDLDEPLADNKTNRKSESGGDKSWASIANKSKPRNSFLDSDSGSEICYPRKEMRKTQQMSLYGSPKSLKKTSNKRKRTSKTLVKDSDDEVKPREEVKEETRMDSKGSKKEKVKKSLANVEDSEDDVFSRRKQPSKKEEKSIERKRTEYQSDLSDDDTKEEEVDENAYVDKILSNINDKRRGRYKQVNTGPESPRKDKIINRKKGNEIESSTHPEESKENIFKRVQENGKKEQVSAKPSPIRRSDKRKRADETSDEEPALLDNEINRKQRLESTSSVEDENAPKKQKNKSIAVKKIPKNVNRKNTKGETILHSACVKEDVDYVEALLAAGADPNTKDNSDWTPLQEAASFGNYRICELLLQHGAFPNTPGYERKTALHDAVNEDNVDVVRLLLKHNANANAYDKYGKTPEKYFKSKQVLDLLRAHADVLDQSVENISNNLNITLNQTIGAADAKIVIYGSNLSNTSRKNLAELAARHKGKVVTSFRPAVTHVVMDTDDFGYVQLNCDMLHTILGGKWLLSSDWFAMCEDSLTEIDPCLFEITTRDIDDSPHRSRENADKQNPPLFDNCHFYFALSPNGTYNYASMELTKQELCKLVKAGGGQILTREPKPDDGQRSVTPFHVAQNPEHPLYKCSYFTIYVPQEKPEPRVKYNMKHLKCLPLIWFIESIAKFTLLDPAIFGLTEEEQS